MSIATKTAGFGVKAGTRTARFGIGAAIAIALSPIVGPWRDRPGKVERHAQADFWERWPQVLGCSFWVLIACWSATDFAGHPAFVAEVATRLCLDVAPRFTWVTALTLIACLVLMRRIMAAGGSAWRMGGLNGIERALRSWGRRDAFVWLLVLAATCVTWVRHPAHPGLLITTATIASAGWLACREVSERRRLDRNIDWVLTCMGCQDPQRDRIRSMPVGWRPMEFVVNIPDRAKPKAGDIEAWLAEHRPKYEARLRHSGQYGNFAVEFRKASNETIALRRQRAMLGDLVMSLEATGIDTATRPVEHIAHLKPGVTESSAERLDDLVHGALGLSLVAWDKGAQVAYLAQLDALTRRERKRLVGHLPGVKAPWDVDIAFRCDETGRVDRSLLTRFPAITEASKRREAILAAARTLWPAPDGFRWFLNDDPAHDTVSLELREDPLRHATPHPGKRMDCDPTAIEIGVREDGTPFAHPVLGCHTILIGSSGSGKGSVLWSLISGLMPGVHAGWVQIHGIDLKGGVEFGFGPTAFESLAFEPGAALDVLRNAADLLRHRLDSMREHGQRLHKPTVKEPLIFIVLDEAGALKMRLAKPEYDEAVALLKEILTQGRAAGVSVFAALQDPRKDAFEVRDLFTRQLALRLKSADETVMAIGRALWEQGAHCEEISPTQQGTGYSLAIDDSDTSMTRFRAYWVSDEQVPEFTKRDAQPVVNAMPIIVPAPSLAEAEASDEPLIVNLDGLAFDLDDLGFSEEPDVVPFEDDDFETPTSLHPLPVSPGGDDGGDFEDLPAPVRVPPPPGPDPFATMDWSKR